MTVKVMVHIAAAEAGVRSARDHITDTEVMQNNIVAHTAVAENDVTNISVVTATVIINFTVLDNTA